MNSLLQELENNEAVLLMHLSGELGPTDAAEVEQMVAADPALAEQLWQMGLDYQAVVKGLSELDAADAPASNADMASERRMRQIARLLRQWQVDRLSRPAPAPARHHRRFAWWTYPLATGVAALFIITVWWGFRPELPVATPADTNDNSAIAVNLTPPTGAPSAPAAAGSGVEEAVASNSVAPDAQLLEGDQQAATLAHRSDSTALATSIFMTDNNTN